MTYALAPAVLASGIMGLGAGVASAHDKAANRTVSEAQPTPRVNPIEEKRSMCVVYHDKNSCQSLMVSTKMTKLVKDCLIKGAIGGAGALIVGRYVSKDLAEDIAAKVVVAGATGCLSSLA